MTDKTQLFLEKFKGDFEKMKQAALGIAVAQRCEPCINLHVQKCLEAGNSPAETLEAACVAVMMQGGPAYTHIPVVIEALESLAPKT
jgi:AhpD family alkylhydroperoxidase